MVVRSYVAILKTVRCAGALVLSLTLWFGAARASDVQIGGFSGETATAFPVVAPPKPTWLFSPGHMPAWRNLEPGLDLGVFPAQVGQDAPFEMLILRIDPAQFRFSVHSAPSAGEARTLEAWGEEQDLVAVINASMYLPDGLTSTGYLRSGEQVNNDRIVRSFGAFLVADPDTTGLPDADLLDRTTDDWEVLLPHYRMVVQNYRLISSNRHLLWNPGGPLHAISAVAKDGDGNFLFILCREPITGVDFGNLLLALPIDVRLVMYTEGGGQAGLFVRSQALRQLWIGHFFGDILVSKKGVPLPNVIGIRRRF